MVDSSPFRPRFATEPVDEGLDGLVDKRLSQVSARPAPVDEVLRTVSLYRERYDDCNVKHFYSFCRRQHTSIVRRQCRRRSPARRRWAHRPHPFGRVFLPCARAAEAAEGP